LALPNIDADKAFGVQFEHSDSTVTTKFISVQSALLYTTSSGERRIRVFTQCLPVTSTLADLFRLADVEAITALTMKMAIEKALSSRLSDAREALVNKCIDILTVYKTDLATSSSSTQLLLPDSLKLFPLYILGIVKNVMFRAGTDIRPDERSFALMVARTLPISLIIPIIYPRLYALHNMPEQAGLLGPDGSVALPPLLNLSSEKLDRAGAFLLEDGQSLYLWVGKQIHPGFLAEVFGVPALEALDIHQTRLPQLENSLSGRINAIISVVRASRPTFMTLQFVREGDAKEHKFFSYFIEDRTKTIHSYYEFLMNLHQRIQSKISNK